MVWGRRIDPKWLRLAGGPVDGFRTTDYVLAMAHERSPFDDTDAAAEAASEARAEADVAEGRLVSHAAMRRWLASWGTGSRLPRPRVEACTA